MHREDHGASTGASINNRDRRVHLDRLKQRGTQRLKGLMGHLEKAGLALVALTLFQLLCVVDRKSLCLSLIRFGEPRQALCERHLHGGR